MILEQLFNSAHGSYTYLLASRRGAEAILIDPVKEDVPLYLDLLRRHSARLAIAADTHVHADHVTALGALASLTRCETALGAKAGVKCAIRQLRDGDILLAGEVVLKAIHTPGHTPESFSFVLEPRLARAVFTGDTLLVRGTGRTDLQGGDSVQAWESINRKLFTLPDETIVYPGHDYEGRRLSTIGEERLHNPRLAGKSQAEYVAAMRGLGLEIPRLMHVNVAANRACGQP